MANEEHVKILKGGVEGWNKWRGENPGVQPNLIGANRARVNLTGADLIRANLARANLSHVNLNHANLTLANLNHADLTGAGLTGAGLTGAGLSNANLSNANLSSANLSSADLNHASLNHANLARADLTRADLARADLTNADLTLADLIRANLTLANLTLANLTGANLGQTVFAGVDLRQTQGLDTANHRAPSTVGTDTLKLSHGQLPRDFLKGCGLSDWEIEVAKLWNPKLNADERTTIWYEIERLQSEQPINFHRIFISYTRHDELSSKL